MEKLKIGVLGAWRGMHVAKDFRLLNCEVVALCDNHKKRCEEAAAKVNNEIAVYDNFDEFINHDMDAVILANTFHEHAPYIIKCFEKGIHVYSECISNGTMAEGVELAEAYEKTNSIFMLAENYPQMIFNREMKRVCDTGTLGKILYDEGEYNHPVHPNDAGFYKDFVYYPHHWRNFLPRTYYITHSIGPIMWATGATPKRVTAFAAFSPTPEEFPAASYVGDKAAIITTLNDDGSIFRVTGCAAFGAHHNSYRICGTQGQIENLRGMGKQVMLRYNGSAIPEGLSTTNLYEPEWNDKDEELIKQSGHGGGDYLTARMFLDCIREGKQPEHPFDLHSAINMSSVGILSWRSVLEGGTPYDIPDFRLAEDREKYRNDRLTPFYGSDGSEPTLPCCSHTDYKPTDEQIRKYKELIDYKD